jgi:hypothetical protein
MYIFVIFCSVFNGEQSLNVLSSLENNAYNCTTNLQSAT